MLGCWHKQMKKLNFKISWNLDKGSFSSLSLLPFWCGLVAGLVGGALSRFGVLSAFLGQ
jgi:hypothetical protein